MARTELPNGVILPAEYSDDWYEDMTSNLTKLDDVIGSDSEKLNSNDVAFLRMSSAALTDGGTGNFSDLNSSNKLKTGDYVLDSGRKLYQVVSVDSTDETFTVGNSLFKITAESDLAPVAESGDYDDLDNKPDLNPYDQHIANTDIHVTTADKSKWNNNVTQSYVFRYSSTALVASSTNSNTLLDNTDNLKVGDKVIDSDGVLFSITAIDSVNSTFTVGSALIDIALDPNVVHTSGDETINGIKTFNDKMTLLNAVRGMDITSQTINCNDLISNAGGDIKLYRCTSISGASNISNIPLQTAFILIVLQTKYTGANDTRAIQKFYDVGSSSQPISYTRALYNGTWSNWQKDTDKFVTTDTDQSISARKIFNVTPFIYNPDFTESTPNLFLKSSKAIKGDTSGSNSDNIRIPFTDKNDKLINYIQFRKTSNGNSDITLYCATIDSNNQDISSGLTFFKAVDGSSVLRSISDNDVSLGNNSYKFKDVRTYLLNGVAPSGLSMPTDNLSNIIDISGYLTVLDGSQANTYQAPDNGYIGITLNNCTGIQAYITGLWGHQIVRPTAGGVRFFMPVLKNKTINILIFGGAIDNARFIPCQGNI